MEITGVNKTKLCSGPASRVHIFNVGTIIMQSLNIKKMKALRSSYSLHKLVIPKVWRTDVQTDGRTD